MISTPQRIAREDTSQTDRWIVTDSSLHPALRHGHTTLPGFARIHALTHSLDSQWRLVASMQSADSQRGRQSGRWSFSAHLLASPKRWAVAAVQDSTWFRTRDGGLSPIEHALEQAVVETTVAGLVRRFATGTRLPRFGLDRPVSASHQVQAPVPWTQEARLDVLAYLLMEQDFEGKAAEAMLIDLSFGAGAVQRHRRDVDVDVARNKVRRAVTARFMRLVEHASTTGLLHREAGKAERGEIALQRLLKERFADETTTTLDESFVDVEEQVYRDYFGDVLDEARASQRAARK
jgi:hypothetical protein